MDQILDDLKEIERCDAQDMLGHLRNFPEQLEDAIRLAEAFEIQDFKPRQIIIAGVGGSAIGGDILATWLYNRIDIPIIVIRDYNLPLFVDENTLLFTVSYSGNTEETLSLFSEGIKRQCRIVAITSGGKLEELGKNENIKLISIPKRIPPRAAIAYLFMPMVIVLKKLGLHDPEDELKVAIDSLKRQKEQMVPENPAEKNPAKQIALKLRGEIPIIYGGGMYKVVARRWGTQLNENAKMLAWFATFPEMNHNEIEAWASDDNSKKLTAVLLRDNFALESPLQKRFGLTKSSIFEKYTKKVVEVIAFGGEEKDHLARMLYSLYLGDFVSVYLAILQGIDPTPVSAIEGFKRDLAGI